VLILVNIENTHAPYHVTCALGRGGGNFCQHFLESSFVFTMKLLWLYDEGKSTLYVKIIHGRKLKAV